MEKKYLDKVFHDLTSEICDWQRDFNQRTKDKNFLEIIDFVSFCIARGVVIMSGKNRLCAYIGPYYKTKAVNDFYQKKNACVRFAVCGHHWFWLGYGDEQTINQLTTNEECAKNFKINCLEQDVEEIAIVLSLRLSLEHYFGENNRIVCYIGSRRTCRILKKRYGGVYRLHRNYWCWIGKCSFANIDEAIAKARQSKIYKVRKSLIEKGLVPD